MNTFDKDKDYNMGDTVIFNGMVYECLADIPSQQADAIPGNELYWKPTFVKLPDIIMRGYTESCDTKVVPTNTTVGITILGYYFDKLTEVSIPNFTINSMDITPREIHLNVTSSDVISTNDIVITKNGIKNDGTALQLKITNEVTGTGKPGTFVTDFNSKSKGQALWGDNWKVTADPSINLDKLFRSSSSTTPSYGTGAGKTYDGTRYMYTERSNPNYSSSLTGKDAFAETSNFANLKSISFVYHRYGDTMGDFIIESKGMDDKWTERYKLTGQQQTASSDDWIDSGSIDTSTWFASKIRFIFKTPAAYTSDMCMDNITLISE